MPVKLFALFVLFSQTTAHADQSLCLAQAPDTAYFTTQVDEEDAGALTAFGSVAVARAERIVARATGCSFRSLGFARSGSNCVDTGTNAASPVCTLEAAPGYFTVLHDFLGTAIVIFTRWD